MRIETECTSARTSMRPRSGSDGAQQLIWESFTPMVPELIPTKEVTTQNPLQEYITRFDTQWHEEGLPQDWYNLRGKKHEIGFSMQKQLKLLEEPQDKDALATWVDKTRQDLVGFKLEYLSRHIVYPCKYERSADGTRLESKEYGGQDMDESVSAEERNGSVKDALQEMKSFFLADDTPDGSIAVMASPKGPSGLRTDGGQSIDYPDSYFFIMQKQGDTVTNFTVKTDFSLHESREAMYQLTGKKVSLDAPLADHVRAVATIKPGEGTPPNSVVDVAKSLQSVRPSHAYASEADGKIGWSQAIDEIRKGNELYNFNQETEQVIADFETYAREGTHTKEELQKAIAATILRLSKLFVGEKQPAVDVSMHADAWYMLGADRDTRYGYALDQVAQRPGCAGGGGSSYVVNSVVSRLGIGGKEQEWFTCPECLYKATGRVGNMCPGCGLTKEEYAEKSGVRCD